MTYVTISKMIENWKTETKVGNKKLIAAIDDTDTQRARRMLIVFNSNTNSSKMVELAQWVTGVDTTNWTIVHVDLDERGTLDYWMDVGALQHEFKTDMDKVNNKYKKKKVNDRIEVSCILPCELRKQYLTQLQSMLRMRNPIAINMRDDIVIRCYMLAAEALVVERIGPNSLGHLEGKNVGAILTSASGRVLSYGLNAGNHNNSWHAEVNALQAYYGYGTVEDQARYLFTTHKPCHMCAGMIRTLGGDKITVYYGNDDIGQRNTPLDLTPAMHMEIGCTVLARPDGGMDLSKLNSKSNQSRDDHDVTSELARRLRCAYNTYVMFNSTSITVSQDVDATSVRAINYLQTLPPLRNN